MRCAYSFSCPNPVRPNSGAMASSSSVYSNPPCAACKFLRRKCVSTCVFAAYFPPEDPTKFVNVHKVFGASNVSKLLSDIPPHQREDAVNSLAYEAEARLKDPVYGCVGAISVLQKQVFSLQKELDAANADIMRYASSSSGSNEISSAGNLMMGREYGAGAGCFDPDLWSWRSGGEENPGKGEDA